MICRLHWAILAATVTMGTTVAGLSTPSSVPARRSFVAADGLSAILLMDTSASVSRSAMLLDPRFTEVFNAFLRGLKAGDRAAVGVIASRPRFTSLTADVREMTAGVRTLLRVLDADRLGPSPIWDATDEALTMLEGEATRPVIVLFTDGKSSGNLHGSAEVLAHATRLGATIHAVIEGGGTRLILQPTAALDPADVVGRVAEGSGGRLLLDRPPSARDRNPARAVTQIMEAIQGR
jgi:hypothetical protein